MLVNYSDCSMDDLVYAISKGRSFVAQRKNGTYVLVMSYNQTDLRYYDPTNGKSVKANRKKLESEFKQAGSVLLRICQLDFVFRVRTMSRQKF